MSGSSLVVPLAIAALVVVVLLVAALYAKNYVKVPPNMVAVFTGRGKQKVVRGGARFKIPVLERVDFMHLEPFNVEAQVSSVLSNNGVPVNVTAMALVRFGSDETMVATAVERFLTSNRQEMHGQVREIIAGNLRAIVSQMTVEELNSNRDELTKSVKKEAEDAFSPIGMQLDVLTIQSISDNNGYLDALGSRRIAEVKRDAAVGEAEADRETRINKAAADQAAAQAEAIARTAVAEAEQRRDLRVAQLRAETDAETARAEQAGPLAQAEARVAVEVAEAEADRRREEAQVDVERKRAERAEQAQRADTIVPAEAARTAVALKAEGEKDATIAQAQAQAEERKLLGQADAEARTVQAEATQTEMEAAAAGELASLKAQAEGTKELAEAQNAFTDSAQRLQVLPQIIGALPEIAKAIADGVKIDHLVVMDGGSSTGKDGALSRAASSVPVGLFQLNETMKAMGFDLSGFLGSIMPTVSDEENSSKGGSDEENDSPPPSIPEAAESAQP